MRKVFFILTLLVSILLLNCSVQYPICDGHNQNVRVKQLIRIDSGFTEKQRVLIIAALEEWRRAAEPVYDYDYQYTSMSKDDVMFLLTEKERWDSFGNGEIFIMIAAASDIDPEKKSWVGYHTLKWGVNYIGILNERLVNAEDNLYKNVVIHELGHAYGLGHSDSKLKSVMTPVVNDTSGCVTKEDLINLCELWCCDPEVLHPCDEQLQHGPVAPLKPTSLNYY